MTHATLRYFNRYVAVAEYFRHFRRERDSRVIEEGHFLMIDLFFFRQGIFLLLGEFRIFFITLLQKGLIYLRFRVTITL